MSTLYIADDFGHAETIDRAILELAQQRAIDGTSVMVTGPSLAHLAQLRELPNLSIGLHLCLTWGRPVSSPARLGRLLTPDGSFGDLPQLLRLCLTGRLDPQGLRHEIAAQIELLRSATGRIDYIDGHQHVHLLPPIERALEDVLLMQSGELRVRMGRLRTGRIGHRVLINAMVGLRRGWPRELPFSTTDAMADYESFSEGQLCRESTEVMLHVAHPDVPDPRLDATSYSFAARVAQFTRRASAARSVQ